MFKSRNWESRKRPEKQKVESRKQKSTSTLAFGAIDHCGEDRHELRRLLLQRLRELWFDSTLLPKEFKPELAFVGFLEGPTELGYELLI